MDVTLAQGLPSAKKVRHWIRTGIAPTSAKSHRVYDAYRSPPDHKEKHVSKNRKESNMDPKERMPFVLCWLGVIIALAGEVLVGFSATRDFVLIGSNDVSIGLGILIFVGGLIIYHASYTILRQRAIVKPQF